MTQGMRMRHTGRRDVGFEEDLDNALVEMRCGDCGNTVWLASLSDSITCFRCDPVWETGNAIAARALLTWASGVQARMDWDSNNPVDWEIAKVITRAAGMSGKQLYDLVKGRFDTFMLRDAV